ncbi:MAG: hypothetical protein Q8M95_11555 [Candidatus Methanoperedens sp.]|nr:hypothetical protein [Candidatus Methanoperedens sp.]
MIDYTKESKQNVNSAVEKLKKDLMDNKWGVLSIIDAKKILAVEAEDALKKIIDMQV